ELFSAAPSSWYQYCIKVSKINEMTTTAPIDDFDFIAHAAEDAGPWQKETCFWYDILADECFSVSQEDFLTEAEVIKYWQYVEISDSSETSFFVSHEVLTLGK
ncbi:unnamed protein product, partial [Prorocentrum cordatum]